MALPDASISCIWPDSSLDSTALHCIALNWNQLKPLTCVVQLVFGHLYCRSSVMVYIVFYVVFLAVFCYGLLLTWRSQRQTLHHLRSHPIAFDLTTNRRWNASQSVGKWPNRSNRTNWILIFRFLLILAIFINSFIDKPGFFSPFFPSVPRKLFKLVY